MTFAVIRFKSVGPNNASDFAPAHIMRVERETPKRLTGFILNEAGEEERLRLGFYDQKPKARDQAGSVDRGREVARFATFGSALLCLGKMRGVWHGESITDLKLAGRENADALETLEAKRAEYLAALPQWLAAEKAAADATKKKVMAALADLYQRRNAAIMTIVEAGKETSHAA